MSGEFCGSCGQRAGAPPTRVATPIAPIADNLAGMLCYLVGFITGIIFLVVEPYSRNRAIRFHAFQSIFLNVVWVAVVIVERIIDAIALSISWNLLWIFSGLWTIVGLGFVVLWVLLMVKAYQGHRFKLPVIGDLAEKQA